MNREECESKLLEKAREMREIYRQYNSEDDYLTICISDNYIAINNSGFNEDYSLPVVDTFVFDK